MSRLAALGSGWGTAAEGEGAEEEVQTLTYFSDSASKKNRTNTEYGNCWSL